MKVASENSDTVKPHVNKILHVQKQFTCSKKYLLDTRAHLRFKKSFPIVSANFK